MRRALLLGLCGLAATGCDPSALLAPTFPAPGPDGGARLPLDAGLSRRDAGARDAGDDDGPPCSCPDLPAACEAMPASTPIFSDDRRAMQSALLDLFSCARERLQIASYELSWPCVVDALRARLTAEPGLVVELVIDDDRCPRVDGRLSCDLARLEGHPRVTIVDDARSRYMHHKFIVADGQRVWVSSANLTRNSFCGDLNDAIVVEEPAIVAAYAERFRRLFVDRAFGPQPPTGPAQGGDYAVRFSPETPIDSPAAWHQALGAAIRTASTSVDFMINAWTTPDLADAMIAAKARGVSVRGLVSLAWVDDAPARAAFAAGIALRKADVHSKVLIVDGRRVATGSPNWSVNAWANNEDSLWVESSTVARAYLDAFERLFAAGAPP
jgi:phosphatidylserine/phosphatidylglycerophosphate/cardiolipin synthase-like enzyme